MDPLTIAAIGAPIASGIASVLGTSSTNRQNLRIAREQMNFNAAEAQKQRDFIAQQNADSQKYNSAKEQVARLRQAGLNPYMADVQAGQASSTASGSAASASGVPQMQTPDYAAIGSGVSAALLQAASVDKTKAETSAIRQQGIGLEIENQYKHQETQLRIAETISRIQNSNMDTAQKAMLIKDLSRQYNENQQTFEARKAQIEKQNALYDAQKEQALSQAAFTSSQKVIAEVQSKANLRLTAAQTDAVYQGIKESGARILQLQEEGKLTKETVKNVAADTAKKIAEKAGIDASNKAYPKVVKKIEAEIRSLNHIHGTYGVKLGALGTVGVEGEFNNTK